MFTTNVDTKVNTDNPNFRINTRRQYKVYRGVDFE